MKKVCLLIFTLLIFWVSACDDEAPDYPDTKLIKGQWQLVEDGSNDNPLIYRFITDGENTWSWGGIVTYYLLPDGTADFYKRYTWHVSDPANENDGKPRLELTWYDAPNSDNLWDATEYYIVVKLTPTEMWLRPHQKGVPDDIKKFIRRNDLPIPSIQFPNP